MYRYEQEAATFHRKLIKWGVGGVVGGLFLIAAALDGFYNIDQGELGVQLRAGEVTGIAAAGFHVQVPFVDSVKIVSMQTHKYNYQTESYSRDIQAASMDLAVSLSVDPSRVEEVYVNYGGLDGMVDRVVRPVVLAQTKIIFGKFNASVAISERDRLNIEVFDAIQQELHAKGVPVIVHNVQLEDISFSAIFEESVEQRMLAEVAVEKAKQNLEKEKVDADIKRTQALGQADKVRFEAQAQAEAIELVGQAEAAAIEARGNALRNNPQVIDLVQAERWDGALPQTMIPGGAIPFIDIAPRQSNQ